LITTVTIQGPKSLGLVQGGIIRVSADEQDRLIDEYVRLFFSDLA